MSVKHGFACTFYTARATLLASLALSRRNESVSRTNEGQRSLRGRSSNFADLGWQWPGHSQE